MSELHRALVDVVGPSHLLAEPTMVAGYVEDWTGRWAGSTRAVVRPGTVGEVQEVIRVCMEHDVPLVPQGGNTGLVGGSIPHHGEVVLSMRRLDRLGPVDTTAREVVVEAGVTLAALRDHALRAGPIYWLDLAARDSATVGGTIATNAGGINVIAYGDTARQVIGLEAVLGDGSVISSLWRGRKESVGPDPTRLLVGSEGTLAVITRARLRLIPPPGGDRMVTMVAVERLEEGLRQVRPGTLALEFLDRACLEAVASHRGLTLPLSTEAPYYLLIESEGSPLLPDDAVAVVDRRLWSFREAITETLGTIGVPVKLDVAVPSDRLDQFALEVTGGSIDGDVYLFGHLAEGNFHVNVLDSPDPGLVMDRVLGIALEMGGAIASEHGIGVAKALWWRRSLDPGLLRLHREIKDVFDPENLLNPEALWGGEPSAPR